MPRLVKFSGALTDGSGKPLSGVVGVTFALYEEERGGAPLWMETQNVKADANGHYTAMLGSTRNDGIPAEVFASGQARWLGVQPQGETERPRVLMASVPYALKAVDAETLGGLPPSAFALAGTAAAPLGHSAVAGASKSGQSASGQSSPDATPDVTGTGTANHIAYWTTSTALGSSALYQTASKKVGLGTTTPSTALDVVSASATAILGNATATSGSFNGVSGQSASSGGNGVFGSNTATSGGNGVFGQTAATNANGVFGINTATSSFAVGVNGQTNSPGGTGVNGLNLATTGGNGVQGQSNATSGGNGVFGADAGIGNGVLGVNSATSGFAVGVNGQTSSPGGTGVNGLNLATTGGNGVQGQSNATSGGNGVYGSAVSTSGNGVFGINNATSGFAVGVNGQTNSPAGTGVNGLNLATTGGNGGNFTSNATSGYSNGVYGQSSSTNGNGVTGNATATTGNTNGVYGSAASSGGSNGVFGYNSATSGFAVGVNGQTSSPGGVGVNGVNNATTGGNGGTFISNATSGFAVGVNGQTSSPGGAGVAGTATATSGFAIGVNGSTNSPGGAGVFGFNNSSGGFGLDGQAGASGVAVFGVNQTCTSSCTLVNGTAGQFVTGAGGRLLQGFGGSYGNQVFYVDAGGNGFFAGNLNVTGTVSKGGGSFKIDHPLDPANKYLSHSFVESPDMMDVYNGMVRLDAKGEAWVNLPDYFEALNGDFRYQLTAIGAPAPRLYVAREVTQNRFKIAGGRPGGKVSWQVTGIRHDAYANAHRIPVTEDKPSTEQGTYLHPDVFGQGVQSGASARPASAGLPE